MGASAVRRVRVADRAAPGREVGAQESLEEAAVVGDAEVEELMDDHDALEGGRLAE